MRLSSARRAATGVLTTIAMLSTGLLVAAPAEATNRVTPGSFTGYAFDARCTPTQPEMDQWLATSPFLGVGVYIGGAERACTEPAPTRAWVNRQSRRGWKVLPIWVGPQASCTGYATLIDPSPAREYAAARAQGKAQAGQAARTAGRLGIPQGSTLWYDLEDFDPGHSDDCRRSALGFLSAWTIRLHRLGFESGVYSNVAAAIHALDFADTASPGSYVMPDQIWYAWANGRADTWIPRKWVRSGSWSPGKAMGRPARSAAGRSRSRCCARSLRRLPPRSRCGCRCRWSSPPGPAWSPGRSPRHPAVHRSPRCRSGSRRPCWSPRTGKR